MPSFEGATRKLLANANGYGQACGLSPTPTAVLSRFYFDILVAGTNLKETFWTSGPANKSGLLSISKVSSSVTPLRVKTTTGMRPLTIEFAKGIDYRPVAAKTIGQARFQVQVVSSGVKGCAKGKTGTLTISTQPAVSLAICGQTFLQGEAPARIAFTT